MPFPSWLLNSRPVASMAKGLMNKAIRPAIGRVVTNTIDPFSYDLKNKVKALMGNPTGAAKSVLQDKPFQALDGWSETRDTPFRQMFGLKPRAAIEAYKTNPDGTLAFNQATPSGLNNLKEITQWAETNGHSTMGGFGKSYDPNTGRMQYFDKWDLGLNPGEVINKANAPQNVARWLMDKVTNIPIIKGDINFKGSAGRGLGKAVKFQGAPGQESYYETNAPGDLTRAIGLPQQRFDAIRDRVHRGASNLIERGSAPDLNPQQSADYNSLFEKKMNFLAKMKHVADLRRDHTTAGITFNEQGIPKYLREGPSLSEALIGGKDYAQLGHLVKRVEQAAPTLRKGFDTLDRSIVPLGLTGGLMYGHEEAGKHLTPINFV